MKDEAENKKVTSLKVLLFLKGSCSPFLMKDVLTEMCQVFKIVTYEGKWLNFNLSHRNYWVGRDPQGSSRPVPKGMSLRGIQPMHLALLGPISNQLSWSHIFVMDGLTWNYLFWKYYWFHTEFSFGVLVSPLTRQKLVNWSQAVASPLWVNPFDIRPFPQFLLVRTLKFPPFLSESDPPSPTQSTKSPSHHCQTPNFGMQSAFHLYLK